MLTKSLQTGQTGHSCEAPEQRIPRVLAMCWVSIVLWYYYWKSHWSHAAQKYGNSDCREISETMRLAETSENSKASEAEHVHQKDTK